MKTEIKIAIGVGAFALLIGAWYLVNREEQKQQEAHSATAMPELPELKLPKEETGKITKLVVVNQDKGEFVLEKKGDEWQLTKPIAAVANQSNVEQVLQNLEKLELTLQIATGTKSYKKYDLEGDKAVHFTAYQGDKKTFDMYFGKSGTRGQMARFADKEGVFIIKGYSSYLFTKDLKGWRKTEIWKFNDENVIQASVENKHGKFSFSKNDDKWSATLAERNDKGELAAEPKPVERFDEAKLKNMLRAFKNLRADDFAKDGIKEDESGLGDPQKHGGIVFLKLKDDAGDLTLKVGKKSKGSSRYAVEGSGDTIYTIGSWSADWAVADQEKFQKDKKDDEAKGDDDDDEEGDVDDDEGDDDAKDDKAKDDKAKDDKAKDDKAKDDKAKDAKAKDAKAKEAKPKEAPPPKAPPKEAKP